MESAEERLWRVQGQARAQAAQAQDFFSDLEQWEKSISQKDEQLKRASAVARKLPPVRSHAAQGNVSDDTPNAANPKETEQVKGHAEATSKPQRIKSADYRSWDKFDVDAELEKLEHEEEQEEEQSFKARIHAQREELQRDAGEEEPAMSDVELRSHMALCEKENGNAQFKEGKYMAAAECYTRGLEFDPNNATLYANRAMAYLKLKKHEDVVRDATEALRCDPKYIKAYSRRATANTALHRYDAAIQDWSAILRIDEKHKQARKELAATKKKKQNYEEEQKRSFNPLAQAAKLRDERRRERAARPLVRIPIEDVGTPVNSDDEEEAEEEDQARRSGPVQAKTSSAQPQHQEKEMKEEAQAAVPRDLEVKEGSQTRDVVGETVHQQSQRAASGPGRKSRFMQEVQDKATAEGAARVGRSGRPVVSVGDVVEKTPSVATPTAETKPGEKVGKLWPQAEQTAEQQPAPNESKAPPPTSVPAAAPATTKPVVAGSTTTTAMANPTPMPEPPRSAAEFLGRLQEAVGDAGRVHDMLMSVKPSQVRQFLANQLEADHLLQMAPALAEERDRPVAAFKRLRAALTTARADVVLQFLEEKDRAFLLGKAEDLGRRAAQKGAQSLQQHHVDSVLALLN